MRPAIEAGGRLVGVEDAAVGRIDLQNDRVVAADQAAKAQFAFAQCRFGLLALADVGKHGKKMFGLRARYVDRQPSIQCLDMDLEIFGRTAGGHAAVDLENFRSGFADARDDFADALADDRTQAGECVKRRIDIEVSEIGRLAVLAQDAAVSHAVAHRFEEVGHAFAGERFRARRRDGARRRKSFRIGNRHPLPPPGRWPMNPSAGLHANPKSFDAGR